MRWSTASRYAVLGFSLAVALPASAQSLRVCADPNNMPFSDERGEGFENKIAELIASNLGEPVSYTWWAQRRGFVRNTVKAGLCDIWPGVATRTELLATTRPYYRSAYVFVSRAGDAPDIASFDDPRLRQLTIGVQMIGSDATNTPPAEALSARGMVNNIRGYMLYGDYTQPNPPAAIVSAVAQGKIDIAVVWGPLAGYFAAAQAQPLTVTRVEPLQDGPMRPMAFDISVGLRKGDAELLRRIDHILETEHDRIASILAAYHVPVVPDT